MSITAGVLESAVYQLIDADATEVSTNDLSATVDITLATEATSGEIQSVLLVASETGSGAVRANAGVLFFFDADPNTTSGDTAFSIAERKTIIGQVALASGDWDSDASGASVLKIVAIPFHGVATVYAVFRNTGTAFNDSAADDEELDLLIRYRRDD